MRRARLRSSANLCDQILANVDDIERSRRQLFRNVIEGSGSESLKGVVCVFLVGTAHHDDGSRELSHDVAECLQSIESRHLDVESDHVRIESRDLVERVGAIAGGGSHLKAGLGGDHAGKCRTHESAIVDNQHPHGRTAFGSLSHVR